VEISRVYDLHGSSRHRQGQPFSNQFVKLLQHAYVSVQDMAFELAMQSDEEWLD